MFYLIVGILITAWIILFIVGRKKSRPKDLSELGIVYDTTQIRKIIPKENLYPSLRATSLSVLPEQLHLNLNPHETIVYGTVIDWDVGDGIATIVAFQSGDASLYLSGGQIYIGGYAHENVRQAGLDLVKESQNYLSKAKLSESTSPPDKDCVGFYLLTNKGKYTFQETVENLKNKTSECTKLFDLANNVITEYRRITNDR